MNNNIGYIIHESQAEVFPAKVLESNLNGKTVAEGILQTANEKNRNGRYYSTEELFPQLEAPRTIELLKAGYLRAEMGHPLDTSLQRQSTIDDTNTCARFLKLWHDGNDIWGRFVATNNTNGHAFDLDLKEGCYPAWSLRALGSIVNTGRGAEVRNLRLITYDQVIFPSHTRAYTQRIVSESANISNEKEIKAMNESALIPIMNKDVINFIEQDSKNLKFVKEYLDFAYDDIKINENNTKVILTSKDSGDVVVVNLEAYIHMELMDYADDFMNNYM